MMTKSLRRVPGLLREKVGTAFREKTSVRRCVEEPQRVQAVPKRVHGRW